MDRIEKGRADGRRERDAMGETRLLERLTASDIFLLLWATMAGPPTSAGSPYAQGVRSAFENLARSALVPAVPKAAPTE